MIRGALNRGSRAVRLAALKTWGKTVSLRYDVRNTACIFASGRGGSTWLAEMIASVPGSILQWEPFHRMSNPTAVRLGFERRPYFTAARPPTPRQMQFIKGLFDGSWINLETATRHQSPPPALGDFLRFRRFVVKFVTANASIDWLTETFGVRSILLVRHPCAVVASQIRQGSWQRFDKSRSVTDALLDDFPALRRAYASANTHEEALALAWLVNMLPPLSSSPSNRKWLTVYYEDLVLDPGGGIRAIFDWLGEETPKPVEELHGRPSAMVKGSIQGIDAWRSQLDADQQRRILRMVADAGVQLYGEASTPMDRERPVAASATLLSPGGVAPPGPAGASLP
ncbi:MAG: sulfotransferase [Bauldia sp.]|nr:sulfotransferase [Bauldia sp.]MCW5719331.1 sulfotransferase [Bauldia sp.]